MQRRFVLDTVPTILDAAPLAVCCVGCTSSCGATNGAGFSCGVETFDRSPREPPVRVLLVALILAST